MWKIKLIKDLHLFPHQWTIKDWERKKKGFTSPLFFLPPFQTPDFRWYWLTINLFANHLILIAFKCTFKSTVLFSCYIHSSSSSFFFSFWVFLYINHLRIELLSTWATIACHRLSTLQCWSVLIFFATFDCYFLLSSESTNLK